MYDAKTGGRDRVACGVHTRLIAFDGEHGEPQEATLLIAQRKDGTTPGDTHGVSENGYPGDRQRDGARRHEVERIERDPVGEALQPMVQIVVGHWPCDNIGNQHRDRELP